ncbi:MAG: hypothetical protein ACO239_00520 [Sediminibacterium sp.]
MIIYLPHKVYEKAKLIPEYNVLVEQLEKVMFDGDITSAEWELNDKLPPLHEKVKLVLEKIEKTEYENILMEINLLMNEELSDLTEDNFSRIQEKINLLVDNVEKNIAQIYFLQYQCLFLYEKGNYFNNILREKRKEIVEIFESIQNELLDDETIITYHHQYFDLYMMDLIQKDGLSNSDLVKIFDKFKFDLDSKTNQLLDCKTSTQNSKLKDLLNYNKIYYTKFFYESMMQKADMTLEEKVSLDRNILKYNKKHTYEYKKFNILDLHFYWVRMKSFSNERTYDDFLKIFDELAFYLKSNLQNKNNVIRSLNFYTHVNHLNFLIFLHGIFELDNLISTEFKIDKKIVDLNLSENELKVMNDETKIDPNSTFYVDLKPLKSRLFG